VQERNIDMKKILGKLKSKKKVTIVILLVLCVAVGGVFAVTRKTDNAS
jgi:capsular polysaccharide biosynthesis protein